MSERSRTPITTPIADDRAEYAVLGHVQGRLTPTSARLAPWTCPARRVGRQLRWRWAYSLQRST